MVIFLNSWLLHEFYLSVFFSRNKAPKDLKFTKHLIFDAMLH